MTAAKAPSLYVSGHCSVGRHDNCRGVYAGIECTCPHHTAPPEPDEPPEAAHCPTCTCHPQLRSVS
jgi:hypothetical protein